MERAAFPHEAHSIVFAASKSKVLRARQFIAELEAELADYIGSQPLSAKLKPDGDVDVRWQALTLKPGAIVGDTIHNLRSALDLMAAELARGHSGSDDGVYFPFAKSAEELDHQIAKRFAKAGPEAAALVRTFKPYKGGNLALRALHDLDVADKHTGILLTGSQMDFILRGFLDQSGRTEPLIYVDLKALHYVFADVVPVLGGHKVIETLKELVQLVQGILEAFAALIPPRG